MSFLARVYFFNVGPVVSTITCPVTALYSSTGNAGLLFSTCGQVHLEHQHVGRRLVAVAVTAAAAFAAVIVAAADEVERFVAVQVRPEQHGVQSDLGGLREARGCMPQRDRRPWSGPDGRTAGSQRDLNGSVVGLSAIARPGAWRPRPWRPA